MRAVESRRSGVAVKFFQNEIVGQFGSSVMNVTDNKPTFCSAAWINALTNAYTRAAHVAQERSQSNRRAERMVQKVRMAIMRMKAGNERAGMINLQ